MKKYHASILALILAGTPLLAADPTATPAPSSSASPSRLTGSGTIGSATTQPAQTGTGITLTTGDGGLAGETELITPPATNLPPPKILPFPQDESDMKPDPNARFGTLPNGLRYVILPNHTPEGRISLRLLVLAGSFEETEQQRGLAHFLEHMAFNGSAHYPLDTNTEPPTPTLIYYLQHMGMGFGGDTNASTSFDHTLYLLELPHADNKTLAKGLEVFGDYAGGLLLLGDMVEKERGIILSEKRTRDTVSYRTFEAEFNETLGDTLLPKRMPIGQPDVISTAKRDQFVDFWNKWYRPEKLAVVIVGDFQDAGAVEEMVKTAYSGLKPRAAAQEDPSLGKIPQFKGVRTFYHADAESPATQIEITSITPYTHEPDTTARELKLLPRYLALSMLNRRFAILAKKDNAPFVSAGADASENFNFYHDSSVEITCKPEQWQAALAAGEQELRRALKYGFSAGELQDAVANYSRELRKGVKSESTRSSKALAGEIASTLVDRTVFTSPDEDLALLKPALRKITAKECLAALQTAFDAKGRFVLVAGNLQIPGDANAAIAAAFKKSQAVAVTAPVPEKPVVWAYTDFGAPGKIVSRKHIDDLGIDEVTFANGVKLNIKKTDFEAGTISLTARVGSGIVTEPAGKRGLSALAGSTFDLGGLGKLSSDDLQRVFAGNDVDLGFAPTTDAFTFSGETTPDDLLLEMQFLAAKITDPGYRPESLRMAQKGFEETYNSFAHTVSGPRQTDVANLIAGGDPRFGFPPSDLLMQRNLDEVKDWVSPQLAHGAMEVSIIGDLDVDKTIDAAAKTIGALPARSPREDLAPLEKIAFPAASFEKQFTIDSQIPKGHLSIFWPTNDGIDIHRSRRLSLLAAILSDRLRIQVREKIGGTYSPGAYSNASNTFAGYGYIEASIDVNPTMAAKISDVAVATADDLATQGVTDDELERARKPLLTMLNETLRRNDYWLGSVLARAQEKPEMLDWARDRLADYNSITTAELDALAKQYLGKEHVSRVTVQPGDASTAKPAQGGAPSAEK